MYNASKYFSKFFPPLCLIFLPKGSDKVGAELFAVFCVFEFIAQTFCCVWDFYIDWGLFRCWKKGKWGLRE